MSPDDNPWFCSKTLKTLSCGLLITIVIVGSCSAVAAQGSPATVGQWSSVQVWPYRAIHAQLLPTGKVLFWDSYENADFPQLWDPATSTVTPAARAGYNIFCSSFSFLPDGRLLVVGGHISDNVGLSFASTYNPFTDTWTRVANMNAGRWYPTTTTLANGDVLTVSGMADTTTGMNLLPQVWQTASSSWRNLSSAQLQLPYYPYMFLAPNGRVFNAGPNQTTRYLDTSGSGTWTVVDDNNYGARNWGSAVMYEPGKVLITGGIRGDFYFTGSAQAPTNTAETIDLNAPSPLWLYVAPMAYARKHHNLTLLPDGKVLATGGSGGSEDTNSNSSSPTYAAEVWNPTTNTWSTLATNSVYRGYHATAMLLPDGRVLSAGGDNGGASAELFSPAYLFNGARPAITSAPTSVGYGQTFFVGTPDGAAITKATLLSLPSVTHTNNMGQRFNALSFSTTTGGLNITSPANGNVCPPGYYMLFILNGNGVPSVARIIRIDATVPTPPSAPSSLIATAISSSQINLSWVDNSNNEEGFKIERCQGSNCNNFAEIATMGSNITSYSNTGLATSTTYRYRVRSTNGGGDSAYSNTATATTSAPSPPAAPSNLTATPVSSSQINLGWTDNANNETGYRIERSLNQSTWTLITTTAANAVTYSDTGLAPATLYYYRVRATNGSGDSGNSNTANATTASGGSGGAPFTDDFNDNARSGNWVLGMVAATGNHDAAIPVAETNQRLEVSPRANLSGYSYNGYVTTSSYNFTGLQAQVRLVQEASGASTESVLTVGIDGSNRYIIGIRGSNVYYSNVLNGAWTETSQPYNVSTHSYLRIRHNTSGDTIDFETSSDGIIWSLRRSIARNFAITNVKIDVIAGSYQSMATPGVTIYDDFRLETAGAGTVPAAPSSLTATAASSTQINLAWTDNSTNEDGFRIERCQNAGCSTFTEIATVAANVVSYQNTGLTAATTYQYRVRAYNTAGNSAYSNTASATTSVTLPAAPSALSATAASSTQINLAWTDNSNNEDGFRIERCQNAGCSTFTEIATVAPNVVSYQNTGLTAATTYQYRVRAYNTAGNSAYSNTASATTSVTLPAAPSALSATAASSTQINLAWTDNSTNEDGFRIERCQNAGCSTFTEIATVAANVVSYQNTGLTAATTYQYRVRSYNGGGNSAYSNISSATTTGVAPAAPSNLSATAVSSSQIDLAWTDNSNNELGFKIERSLEGILFTEVAAASTNMTTYSDTNVLAGVTYYYRVRSYNQIGHSAYSNTSSATTLILPASPAAPSNLTATPASSSQIDLTWIDNSSTETGFKIERSTDGLIWLPVTTTPPDVTSYNDTGLAASTIYHYRARATRTQGDSANSNVASAITQGSGGGSAPFSDDFNDNLRSPNWIVGMIAAPGNYDPAVGASETNQQLEITLRVNSNANSYNGYLSASSFNFTGLQAKVKLAQAPNGIHAEAVLSVGKDAWNRYIIGFRGGQMYFTSVVNGTWTETSQPYDALVHKFLRIRHNASSDTIDFETSAEGLLWTSRRSIQRTLTLTNVKIDLVAGSNGPEASPGAAFFDDFSLETVLLPPLLMSMTTRETQFHLLDQVNNESSVRSISSLPNERASADFVNRCHFLSVFCGKGLGSGGKS